ncbi:MAG: hypothetical protein ABI591_28965 [Kofleriaceae bacterium]
MVGKGHDKLESLGYGKNFLKKNIPAQQVEVQVLDLDFDLDFDLDYFIQIRSGP